MAELQRSLCGASAGSLEHEREASQGAPLFRPAGQPRALPLPDWRSLRCPRRGGRLHLEEIQTISRRVEPRPGRWWIDRPRRKARPEPPSAS